MSGAASPVAAWLARNRAKESLAPWREDALFVSALHGYATNATAVFSLGHPLRIVRAGGTAALVFDYAYFLLLRDLCRSLALGRATDGALIALYHFEVGRGLDSAGLPWEAAGLLRSACELRASFAVADACDIREAMLYQLAVNITLAHEDGHRLFAEDAGAAGGWAEEARGFLRKLAADASRMYAEENLRRETLDAVETFLASETLIEEVACDLCAVDACIEGAAEQRPAELAIYCDAYYAVQRLNILGLYVARAMARAAAAVVEETTQGRMAAIARIKGSEDLSFLANLRLRFHVLLLKVASLKLRYGLLNAGSGFQPLSDVVGLEEDRFQRVSAGLMTEMHEARNSLAIHRQIWIGRACRRFHPEAPAPSNAELVSLFLRGFWFSPSAG